MANPDFTDYDSLPPQQGDAPLRITVYPRRTEPRFVPVDHDPFADEGAGIGFAKSAAGPVGTPGTIGDAGQFTPIPSSSHKGAAVSILPCAAAHARCVLSPAGTPYWCGVARDTCFRTGLPVIFPGGFVGQSR